MTTRSETRDGGTIALLGSSVDILSAAIDASGKTGGAVRVGQALGGQELLPTADITLVYTGSVVR